MNRYSIIVVNLNNKNGLQKTLCSISSQVFSDREIIVIDGGSSDGSVEIVGTFGKLINKFISEPDKGIYNAMNKGLAMASGEYVVYMNSGDCFYDNHSLGYVCMLNGDIILGGSLYGNNKRFPPHDITLYSLLTTGICHQSTYYRREVLLKYPFDETYKIIADLKTVVEPFAKDRITITPVEQLLSVCEGGGLSKKRWREIGKERCRIIEDCIDPFYQKDYMKLAKLSPEMIGDFATISLFSSLATIIKITAKSSSLLNSVFKKIPMVP